MTTERIPATDRAAWLALRRQDVTASDVAALFGQHPYRTRLQVYAEKTGRSDGIGDNAAMRRGRILEPAIAEAWFEDYGERLTKCSDYVRDPTLRIGATPDYLRPNGEPVELKSVAPDVWESWGEAAPLAYQLQTLVQAMLLDAPRGWLSVMVDNRAKDTHRFEVPRHPGAEAKIIAAVSEFWACVGKGEPPAADYTRDGTAIAAMFPRDNGDVLDWSGDNRMAVLLGRRADLKAIVGPAEDEIDAIDAEVKAKLGEASGASCGGFRISYKAQTRPERVVAASTFRVLRITASKAAKEKAA